MKNKLLYILLLAEAVLCAAAALAFSLPDVSGVMYLGQTPFDEIGSLLRVMSLSGGAGNALAVAMYTILCLIPAAFLIIKLARKRAKAEDALLAVMSGYLFYLMYMMVNPGLLSSLSIGSEDFGKAVLGGVFWSILIGWLVLKLLRYVKGKETPGLLRMLGILFVLAAVIIVFNAAYIGVADLKVDIEAVKAGNTSTSDPMFSGLMGEGFNTAADLAPTITFLVFRFVTGLIPVVTDILILLAAKKLAERLNADRFSLDVIGVSEKLARLCRYAVVIIVLSSIALNIIQLLAAGSLLTMDFVNNIPLGSVILALVMLLLSRYFAESRKIKRENEMFV